MPTPHHNLTKALTFSGSLEVAGGREKNLDPPLPQTVCVSV